MTASPSEPELLDIERRVLAASPGPWQSFVEGRDFDSGSSFIRVGGGESPDIELPGATAADQDFIAAARQDVPRLLQEVRRLRALCGLAQSAAAPDRDGA
jgi:hypothetical protein